MSKKIYDWKLVQAYHDEGHGFVECTHRFGLTHSAWNKAITRGDLHFPARPFSDRRRRFDWARIQAFYDAGHSFRETAVEFGFSSDAWYDAIGRGEIRTRPRGMPIPDLLSGAKRNRSYLKMRLIEAGVFENCCERCGISEWRKKPISIHLDRINGVKDDNRLENLRMLCPNCHSQTPTFSERNIRRRHAALGAP